MKYIPVIGAGILLVCLIATWSVAGTNYPIAPDASPNAFNSKVFRTKVNAAFVELSTTKATLGKQATFGNLSAAKGRFSGQVRFSNKTTVMMSPAGTMIRFSIVSTAANGWYVKGRR